MNAGVGGKVIGSHVYFRRSTGRWTDDGANSRYYCTRPLGLAEEERATSQTSHVSRSPHPPTKSPSSLHNRGSGGGFLGSCAKRKLCPSVRPSSHFWWSRSTRDRQGMRRRGRGRRKWQAVSSLRPLLGCNYRYVRTRK